MPYTPKILCRYFTTAGASGLLDAGKTVMWEFEDFPGAFPIKGIEMKKDELIVTRLWTRAGKWSSWKFSRLDPNGLLHEGLHRVRHKPSQGLSLIQTLGLIKYEIYF
jgi:hypothetical protein